MNLHIVFPERSQDDVSRELRQLTKILSQNDPDAQGYGLGGEYGYGVNFENETFKMFPYYWGDCTCGYEEQPSFDGKHQPSCYQAKLDEAEKESKLDGLNYEEKESKRKTIYNKLCYEFNLPLIGCAVHCTCDYGERLKRYHVLIGYPEGHRSDCLFVIPNFWHKASGLKVRWYKWIGREMEIENPNNYDAVKAVRESIDSIREV